MLPSDSSRPIVLSWVPWIGQWGRIWRSGQIHEADDTSENGTISARKHNIAEPVNQLLLGVPSPPRFVLSFGYHVDVHCPRDCKRLASGPVEDSISKDHRSDTGVSCLCRPNI